MKELMDKIIHNGHVLGDDVLKVDSFITHQIDPELMEKIGTRFSEVFSEAKITKVVTLESSGIAPALFAAKKLQVPMVFARKSKS